jgi:hypothetical protein
MGKRRIAQVFFLIIFLAIGLSAFWLGTRFAHRADSREPAAIPKNFDFSNLEGEALKQASIAQILKGTKVVKAGELTGFEMGHFTMRNSGGVSVSVCDIYPQVELHFVAGDMAVSGESPTMIVTGVCQLADNAALIEPILFDYTSIRKTAVKEKSLRQPQSNSEVVFENVSDSWPKVWVLDSIQFKSDIENDAADKQMLEISAAEIRKNLGRNMAIEY